MTDFLKLLLIFLFIQIANGFNCYLPEKCELELINSVQTDSNEKEHWKLETIIMCAIRDETFEFRYKEPTPQFNTSEKCLINKISDHISPTIVFRWTSTNELSILENRLNLTNALRYINHFYIENYFIVKFWDIKGFDVNLIDFDYNYDQFSYMIMLELTNVRVEFYRNRKRLSSCQDFVIDNQTRIESIFQIKTAYGIIGTHFKLKYIENKNKICPLIFTNAFIFYFSLFDLMETFYKKSILSFTNESFPDLKSFISDVTMENVQNINIDSNLLHPSVFKYTSQIFIFSGSLKSIDGEIFKSLKRLFRVYIHPFIFRKINHRQGLEWIKMWNSGKRVNLSKITVTPKEIVLKGVNGKPLERLPKIFPDEDFCLYIDFPFDQLVILYEEIYTGNAFFIMDNDFTCTYSWLVQYYDAYYNYYSKVDADLYYKQLQRLTVVLRSVGFDYLNCNFTEKIRLCNRSYYQLKDDWDENDFFILNKKLQTVFKISLYPISLLGLVTNFIVVFVILKKENSDLFKEYKQYSYLYMNSIFCMVISLIELLSWMTECFYPFEVFCPEIHKLVAIQFFKIIFKECFITLFRFMLSFTYFAFALNRIGLIGKDHGKLVSFISEVGIKKYIGVSLLISSSLSWIKYFKYEVNYFVSYMSFPISNENNIMKYESTLFNDFYFIFNLISDLVNYLAFVVICAIIDICMVVQLLRTLAEQEKKRESMNQKKKQSSENEEAVNKAIKMVVLNSLIGIFFKFPVCVISVINVCAEFYYKDYYLFYLHRLSTYQISHPRFGEFYSMFTDSGFYELTRDLSYFLFTFSFSIQMFIYNHFDKKFRIGFDRIKENIKKASIK